jgi:hypothetical protein
LKNLLIICLIAVGFTTVLASCEQDRCKARAIVCLNEGGCFDGHCNCPSDFEGDSCEAPVNKKFVNVYGGIKVFPKKYGSDSDDTMVVSIVNGTNNEIKLYSSKRPLLYMLAKVKNNEITIANKYPAIDGFTYTGNGSLNGKTMVLSIQADSNVNEISQRHFEYTFSGNKTIK